MKLVTLASLGIVACLSTIVAKGASAYSTSLGGSNDHSFLRNSFAENVLVRSLEDTPECEADCCQQYVSEICPNDNEWITAIPFVIQILLIAFLICLSALFSGLTLGLMSLDSTGLEIVMSGDNAKAAEYAKIIYPVRKDGNLLLCTLLLGNVTVNSMLSILMAEYTGGVAGILSSTFLIVIFGEILPQAVCSRYALRIGSATVPAVKAIRLLLYPVAKPLAWGLDVSLGKELTTTYSSAEMLKLLQIHVQQNVLDQDTAGAMTGALTYKNIAVKDVMTPMSRTFMLSVDDKLSFQTIAKIFKTGYSRIPIFEVSRDNIIGLLFVKDLIFIDPEDEVPIRSFVQIFGRGVHVVWPDDTLGDVLAELKKGRTHLALVRDVNNTDETQDPYYEIKGIITLEDIIEKIIGDSIVDETDAYEDSGQEVKVQRAETFEWARLRLLDAKIVDELLSPSEVKAVTAHLRVNYEKTVQLLTDSQLSRLVSTTAVSTLEAAKQEVGEAVPKDLLYQKGTTSDVCTLILGGKVTILVGAEDFRSDLSSWSVLGKSAMEKSEFIPDFTAFVSDGPCRCLRFKHSAFVAAVDASAVERSAAENKLVRKPSIAAFTEGTGSVGEASNTSSEVPNRREKLLATLFKEESIDNPIADELSPELTEAVVRSVDSAKSSEIDVDEKETIVRFWEEENGEIVATGSKEKNGDDKKPATSDSAPKKADNEGAQ